MPTVLTRVAFDLEGMAYRPLGSREEDGNQGVDH